MKTPRKNIYIPRIQDHTVDNIKFLWLKLRNCFVHPLVYKFGVQMYKEYYSKIKVENEPTLVKGEKCIFVSTHSFADDVGILIATSKNHLILFTNTIDQLEYNPEFYLLWLNGCCIIKSEDKDSRKDSILRMRKLINLGSKTKSYPLVYVEGSWNITENKIVSHAFPGAAIAALKSGAKIVPLASTLDDNNEVTIKYGDIIEPNNHTVEELTTNVRDVLATLKWKTIARTAKHRDETDKDLVWHVHRKDFAIEEERIKWRDKWIAEALSLKWVDPEWEIEFSSNDDPLAYGNVWSFLSHMTLEEAAKKYLATEKIKYDAYIAEQYELDIVRNLKEICPRWSNDLTSTEKAASKQREEEKEKEDCYYMELGRQSFVRKGKIYFEEAGDEDKDAIYESIGAKNNRNSFFGNIKAALMQSFAGEIALKNHRKEQRLKAIEKGKEIFDNAHARAKEDLFENIYHEKVKVI